QPEIDAVYLASYGASADLKSPTSLHLLITCEAKQARQRILEDQIREQVAKAFEVTAKLKVPEINAVKPMATKVVETSDRSRAIFVVEFSHIDRTKFEAKWERTSELDDRLFSMTLKVASKTIYRITPSVAGLNAP
ncbi:MAG TPA: hypothetical protein VMU71_01375, partial [Terracidiphilus sp.]|nr:hypothetical protein [Terracidiphilus sp.]